MAAVLTANQVVHEDLSDALILADVRNTPFISRIKKGNRLTNMLFSWPVQTMNGRNTTPPAENADVTTYEGDRRHPARRRRLMGISVFNKPLGPPHRRAAWAEAVDDPSEGIESMLPKDVLKYAEKVKDVEAAVLDALKKREEKKVKRTPNFGPLQQASNLPNFLPGSILPMDMSDWFQRQQSLQQAAQIRRDVDGYLSGGNLINW